MDANRIDAVAVDSEMRRNRLAGLVRHALSIYQSLLSPLLVANLGPACRFEPSCSRYAGEAISRYGVGRGSLLAFQRLIRCRPGGGWGYDPVVKRRPATATLPALSSAGEACTPRESLLED